MLLIVVSGFSYLDKFKCVTLAIYGMEKCYWRNDGPWKKNDFTILSDYEKRHIYNAHEFGLFLPGLTSQKTLNLKKEKYAEGKHSKILLTELAAESINGKKLRMFVISKIGNDAASQE